MIRALMVQLVSKNNPKQILDIATGTGDLAIMMSQLNPDKIIGLDISSGMLDVGKRKIANVNLSDKIDMVVGDSENKTHLAIYLSTYLFKVWCASVCHHPSSSMAIIKYHHHHAFR